MDDACQKAIKFDETSAPAYYLAAKAARGMKNDLQAIVMLTKAIMQNEEYKEAYLLRAEVLWDMRQAKDAMSDLDKFFQFHLMKRMLYYLKEKYTQHLVR